MHWGSVNRLGIRGVMGQSFGHRSGLGAHVVENFHHGTWRLNVRGYVHGAATLLLTGFQCCDFFV